MTTLEIHFTRRTWPKLEQAKAFLEKYGTWRVSEHGYEAGRYMLDVPEQSDVATVTKALNYNEVEWRLA